MKRFILAATILTVWACAAYGQAFPQKPIRLVVAFASGGPPDIVGRAVGIEMSKGLGQQIFVDNRVGAGGTIGTAFVAKSPADGYTLLFATPAALLMGPVLFDNAGFDGVDSFAPIGMIGRTSFVLVVNAKLPVKDLKDLIALAKSKPGVLNYAAGLAGTPPHVIFEMFKVQAGVNIVPVHYKGSAPGLTALLAGEVEAAADQLAGVRQYIAAGKFRALVTTTKERTRQLPDVPSAVEAGFPNFAVGLWFGLVAPKGTPAPIITRLHGELSKVIASPDMAVLLDRQGLDVANTTPQEFEEVIKAEKPMWAAAVKASGAKVQ